MEFTNNKGQIVGELKNGMFRKRVKKSKHWMKAYNGWGIDTKILHSLVGRCETVGVHDTENDDYYFTDLDVFITEGFNKDFGYGEQTFLPKEWWQIKDADGELVQERKKMSEELMNPLL